MGELERKAGGIESEGLSSPEQSLSVWKGGLGRPAQAEHPGARTVVISDMLRGERVEDEGGEKKLKVNSNFPPFLLPFSSFPPFSSPTPSLLP